MSRCFITGVAGFIGSAVAERLLKDGHEVMGADCFTDYYSIFQKKSNLKNLLTSPAFTFFEVDLLEFDLATAFTGIDYVFHFAAQPGVRDGFGPNFDLYLKNNIQATKKILDAARGANLKKIIFASSSSVYGQQVVLPTKEDSKLDPVSLYGLTKLTCEKMCGIYFNTFRVPIISLRFFSVYGPKQRPDMAFHKFIKAIITGDRLVINGTGKQSRDFTFIEDIVDANILAMESDIVGEAFNVGNGRSNTIEEAVDILRSLTSKKIKIEFSGSELGDVDNTLADHTKAKSLLGFKAKWTLNEGLKAEFEWLESFY